MKITKVVKIDGGWELYAVNEKEKKEMQVGFCGDRLPIEAWVDMKDVKK